MKTHHLLGKHTRRLNAEFATAHIKQILKTGSKKVYDQNIVQPFLTEMVYLRYASYSGRETVFRKEENGEDGQGRRTTSSKNSVRSAFISQLRSFWFARFLKPIESATPIRKSIETHEFNGDSLRIKKIGSCIVFRTFYVSTLLKKRRRRRRRKRKRVKEMVYDCSIVSCHTCAMTQGALCINTQRWYQTPTAIARNVLKKMKRKMTN